MMDYSSLVERRRQRMEELERLIAAPDFFNDRGAASALMREHRRTRGLLEDWAAWEQCRRQFLENEELARGEDEEMAAMARLENEALAERMAGLEERVQYSLLPRDEAEDRDAIVEIRAGTGGGEASLFAGDLLGMYQRYAVSKGWGFELLSASPSDVGGFRELACRVSGEEVFRFMKYESGVHRVQRVPVTETQGRIHTSTATVAVLPEAGEVDVEIRPEDLRIETCRSGGAGGQHVNRTESAVQIFHLPSGIMVRCEDERSQMKNREKGMRILRARLFEAERRRAHEQYSARRRSLIGSGAREEKIRTYNFPQSRVTDHRVGYTSYNLEGVMAGRLDEFVAVLQRAEMRERMAEAGLGA